MRGGGLIHPKGENGMIVSGPCFRGLVDTGWIIFLLLCTTGLQKQFSDFVVPPCW